jgi:hypothetical protein
MSSTASTPKDILNSGRISESLLGDAYAKGTGTPVLCEEITGGQGNFWLFDLRSEIEQQLT